MANDHTRVLLIEDNPGDADLVRLRLEEGEPDVEVSCVDRLTDGLESLKKQPPSLVLLDLNLPDSHGAETFRKVLDKAPGLPVVVLSGMDNQELALQAVHQGVQDYLVKGEFDAKHLSRTMHYAMERQALIKSLEDSRRQQLTFKDEFLSHMSSELRTPLTSLHLAANILLDGLAGPLFPEQRQHLSAILKNTNQLRGMINDLLDASEAVAEELQVEPRCVALDDLMHRAIAMLPPSAQEKQITLEMRVDTRLPLVFADPGRICQALYNLIENAVKFTPEGGLVTLTAVPDSDENFVCVSVSDTGPGISPEAKLLIFERLYQPPNVEAKALIARRLAQDPNVADVTLRGLGLGLYIAKQLVRLHGGRIWFATQPGQGTTFSFTVPLFSLSRLLFPFVSYKGRLREGISLVTVELTPQSIPGDWEETVRRCPELLRQSIFRDEDLLLPPMGAAEPGEIFFIVATADVEHAAVIVRRIRERLERHAGLNPATDFKVSARAVRCLAAGQSLQDQVDAVAARVSEMVNERLQRRRV